MPKILKKWEVTRAKGMLRFILTRGVLCWGGGVFVMALLFDRYLGRVLTLDWILISAYACTGGGVAWGFIMWRLLERKYRQFNCIER